jgi:hypothetical protein
MSDELKPDLSCVPYRRKGLYLALTVPLLLLMTVVGVYLGAINPLLPGAFVLFYLSTSFFQAYCCAYQECPYVGGFCPAVIGIMPASLLAKWLYGNARLLKSKAKFEFHIALASLSWLGLVVFPLFWLSRLSTGFAIGYVLIHVLYTVIFWTTICPACAIRGICPGGKLHRTLGFTSQD